MRYRALRQLLPRPLARSILHFEALIEDAVKEFAASLPPHARVLDAGAGEGQYRNCFAGKRYCGVDLGIGDAAWNYSGVDVVGDLHALPFATGAFDAACCIVTLEHVQDPLTVMRELSRVLRPAGRLLLVAPQDWEVHQAPHDFFRFTRHGLAHLASAASLNLLRLQPAGGYFRLLSRRLWNGLQFFPGPAFLLWALLVAIPAFLLPWLDFLDPHKNFTLGYLCLAEKPRHPAPEALS